MKLLYIVNVMMSILIHNIGICKYESGNLRGTVIHGFGNHSCLLPSPCLRGRMRTSEHSVVAGEGPVSHRVLAAVEGIKTGQDGGHDMRNELLTRGKAKRLRKNLTDAESKLWRHIRLRQVGGFKFRRQHPVGPYILDFACVEKLLAIEVDGGQHGEYVDYDFKRSAYLETHGYKVLRFWNSDVLNNIEAVKEVIFDTLCGDGLPPPSSSPWKGEERVERQGQRGKSEHKNRNSNN